MCGANSTWSLGSYSIESSSLCSYNIIMHIRKFKELTCKTNKSHYSLPGLGLGSGFRGHLPVKEKLTIILLLRDPIISPVSNYSFEVAASKNRNIL